MANSDFSTTYTSTGSTVDSYSGWGTIFVQAPLTYSTGIFGAATVKSFHAHLSSQSGFDALSISNRTVTLNGNTKTVTTSGNDVYVNNTLYGSYSFSGQDLVFTFSGASSGLGISDPATVGAIMEAVTYQYQSTSFRPAESESVTWSFDGQIGTATAPADTINVAAVSEVIQTEIANEAKFVQVSDANGFTVGGAVTSFDVHLSSQSGKDVLSIQNHTSTWDGHTENVTTNSTNQVFLNSTLVGSYNFLNQDLVFTFNSATSDKDTIGAILDAVAFSNRNDKARSAEDETLSFSFNPSGAAIAAPERVLVDQQVPANGGFAGVNRVVSGYVGAPILLQPSPDAQYVGSATGFWNGGTTFNRFEFDVRIQQGLGQLGIDTSRFSSVQVVNNNPSVTGPEWFIQVDGVTVKVMATDPSLTDLQVSIGTSAFGPAANSAYTAVLQSITYSAPSAVVNPVTILFNNELEQGNGPTTVDTSFGESVIFLSPPTVVTEAATITAGGAVSGSAGTTGTGALAGDSDANGYDLTVSDIGGGVLGSPTHGTYGDLTLNADGSFSYVAGATPNEAVAIEAASGQLTDSFTYSVSDGHGGVSSSELNIGLDATKPSIDAIDFAPSSGDLGIGAREVITLGFSDLGAIDIAGAGPTLHLNNGGTAVYDALASTGTSLVFDYTVQSGDSDVSSLAVSSVDLGSTTLINPSGVADATSTGLSVAGIAQSGPQIDTTIPAFTAIGESPSGGEIGLGARVTFTLTLNEPVAVDTTSGAPTLSLNDNGTAIYDAAASTGTSLVFDYTLAGTDIANVTSLQATLFNLNNAVVTNGAGANANVSLTGLAQSGPAVDLPYVVGGTSLPSSGTFGAGQSVGLIVEVNKAVTVTGSGLTLSLNDGGTATFDAGTTAALEQFGLLAFNYTVAPTDHNVSNLAVTGFTLNGASILDSFGDEVQFFQLPTFSNVAIDTGIACYCRGTSIEVVSGRKNVEDLRIGDMVVTASGAERPIKWIGRRSYRGRFITGRTDILPICLRQGSLGEDLPRRDLWISPHHAMLLDGLLIDAFTKTPSPSPAPEAGRLRGRVDLISDRSIEGWAQNSDHPEAPVCLDVYADGRLIGQTLANRYRADLWRAGLGSGRHAFVFRPPGGTLHLPATIEVRRSLDNALLGRSGLARARSA